MHLHAQDLDFAVRLPAWLVLLAFTLVLCRPLAADSDVPTAVQDLQYGEVLFYYYQQDYFNSIVRLQISQEQESLAHHAGEAELLLGGLDLSYGLRDAADDIFQRLLNDDNRREAVRNRAWFYLAKISYQRDDTVRALRALGQIKGRMSAAIRTEAAQFHSLILIQLGHNDEAIDILKKTHSNKGWSPYLAYNLGVAQIRSNRLTEGSKQLDQLGELAGRNEELRLLRDKANLALGYSYLQNGNADQSRKVLERVRLEGPLSNKALLGTGWADAEQDAYGRALVPWTELSGRSATDPAVQEALLATPYAMTRLGLHGRAVKRYDEAISILFEERQKLDDSIRSIRDGELLAALQEQNPGNGNGWLQPLAVVAGSPALRYQVELMAAHEFQEAVKNYYDLMALQDNLDQWAVSVEAYDDMLATRQARYAAHRPAAEAAMHSDKLATLQQHKTRLADTLVQIETSGDPVGVANAEESRQWQRLNGIESRLMQLPDSAQINALRDKQQRLQGILYWQLNADYKPRLWQAKQQLSELEGLVARTHQARNNLQHTGLDAPDGFTGFSQRITVQKNSIRRLQARTQQTHLAQGIHIEALAVKELEQQKKRLDTYLIQARFALAQTYDSALNTSTEPDHAVIQ